MSRLSFVDDPPVPSVAPNRVDVACFVGFARRRPSAGIADGLRRWLADQGWGSATTGTTTADVEALRDVPVPIDRWEDFDRLFAWERRAEDDPAATYLGSAVGSFFAEGGRKCYVVRAGDSWSRLRTRAERLPLRSQLVPGEARAPMPADRRTWRGIGHLLGLPEVSFVALPDLSDVLAAEPPPPAPASLPPGVPENFVECSGPPPPRGRERLTLIGPAPRCDAEGFAAWAEMIQSAARLLDASAREVQLVAAIPLATPDALSASRYHAGRDLRRFLIDVAGLDRSQRDRNGGLASAFVQLAYPWLRTANSARLAEGLEPPDGVLAGMLARNALVGGTFHSAAGLRPISVNEVEPVLDRSQIGRPGVDRREPRPLIDRVSLFGQGPSGIRLLSDVTTSLDPAYRPACMGRLAGVILRAARRLGEDATFEPSGPNLWARVRRRLNGLFGDLLDAGALRGDSPEEAFRVRCDRGTMTQADLDAGRVIALVEYQPAVPIDRITVALVLEEGGVALQPVGNGEGVGRP